MDMTGRDAAIESAVGTYFATLQGEDTAALLQTVFLPFTLCAGGKLQVFATEADFIAWWKRFMNQIRVETGMARGELRRLSVERLGAMAALVRMLSARLDSQGAVISEQKTGFLLYALPAGWKVSAAVTDITMSG